MAPNKPKLNQLEMLVAVADTGGFGAAAAQLDCTQSRISHAVSELEDILETRLLTRSRTGCAPTEAGLRVIASARHILRMADGLRQDAAPTGAIGGRIRIACFRSVATHLLPQSLSALARRFPALRIDIDDSHEEREAVARAVCEGRAEIGIAQLPVPDALVAYDFAADDYVLVAPAGIRLSTPLEWRELAGIDYLQLNCSGALAILDECRKAGFAAAPARLLSTDSSIMALVRQGLGFSILPQLAIEPLPPEVSTWPLPFPAPRRFAVVALPEVARTAAAKAVIGQMRGSA